MPSAAAIADAALPLVGTFLGQLLQPADSAYDETRRVHNGLIDKRPALIACCRGTADVVDAVRLADKLGLEVAVRGGGHNVAGRSTIDDGLMIDLSPMRGIHVDPVRRTARVQGGATWAGVNRETQLHGLAVTGGVVSTTGVAGLTLSGGLGWLMGKHGLALDNLLSVELVSATSEVVRASAGERPDLFWAVRGGGGNFGIVTSFKFRLHPIGPMVTGGLIAHSFDRARDVLRFYRDATHSLPDEHILFAGLAPRARRIGCEAGGDLHLSLRLWRGGRSSNAAAQAIRLSRSRCARADTVLPAQHHARCGQSEGSAQLLEVEFSGATDR